MMFVCDVCCCDVYGMMFVVVMFVVVMFVVVMFVVVMFVVVMFVQVDRNPEDFQANRGDEGKRVESGEELGEQEDENYKPVKKCLEVQVVYLSIGLT